MDLQNVTVTDLCGVFTVYSLKGRFETMRNRKYDGLSLCMDGQITYIQDGEEIVSHPGRAVFLPKGQTYYIRGDKTGFFPVINFLCTEPLCDRVTAIELSNSESLLKEYEQMKKLFLMEQSRAKLFSIFYDMLSKLSTSDTPRELEPALKKIAAEYPDPSLSNAFLAQACNLSEVYFRKLFTKHFGQSPKQYIIELRMQKAKQLLMEGSMKISAISEKCGFSNAYHFCRTFKQHTGLSPTEYRRENQIYEF